MVTQYTNPFVISRTRHTVQHKPSLNPTPNVRHCSCDETYKTLKIDHTIRL